MHRCFTLALAGLCLYILIDLLQGHKDFNQIRLPAYIPKGKKNISPYLLSIANDRGEVLYSKTIGEKNVKDNRIKLSFEPIGGQGHYCLSIKKLFPGREDIIFFSKYDSYWFGAYDGSLIIDGKDGFVNDVALSVLYYAGEEPYIPEDYAFVLCYFAVLFGWLITLGNLFEERRLEKHNLPV